MSPLAILLTVIVAILSALLAPKIVMRFWPATGKWGIPKKAHVCSVCGASPPVARVPANKRQMLWGGWTCAKCGADLDKYGTVIPADEKRA